jgi:LacI family transcriptional regulator
MALQDTSNFVYPEIIDGAQEAAEKHGTCLFFLKYSSGETAGASLIALVQEGRVDGILWDDLPYTAFGQELIDAHVPFVCLNGYADVEGHCVTLDDREGFLKQAHYLADLGHRRIGFVGTEPQSSVSILCREAFIDGLKGRGISVEGRHVWHCHFQGDDVLPVADSLARDPNRPTAVATASISVAMRLADCLIRNGVRVPEDVSVIGYHDAPDAQWQRPSLTTVKMPSKAQGALAVECLLGLIAGGDLRSKVVPGSAEIVERESCRRA